MKGDSLGAAYEFKRIKKNAFFDSALRSGKEKAQLRTVGLLNWWAGKDLPIKGSQRPRRLAVSGVGSWRIVAGFSNPPFADTESAKNHRVRDHVFITSTHSN